MTKKLPDSFIESLLFLDLSSGSEYELEYGDLDKICVDDNINCLDIDENDFINIDWPWVDNDIFVTVLEVIEQIQTNPIIIHVPLASSLENSQYMSNIQLVHSTHVIPVTKKTH